MATTYSGIIDRVRQWSNRDVEALPNIVIQEGLRWSADTAYRELEIPPLEYTQRYVLITDITERDQTLNSEYGEQVAITGSGSSTLGFTQAKLPIPADLTAFIHIRTEGTANIASTSDGDVKEITWTIDDDGALVVADSGIRSGIVFNEKTDVRTFHDFVAIKTSSAYWTRQRDCILISGRLQQGDVIEVLYYRRLPALDARYSVNAMDFRESEIISTYVDEEIMSDGIWTLTEINDFIATDVEPSRNLSDWFQLDLEVDEYYLGTLIEHWLREQNERILIFGALWQCFDYLADDAMASKFAQKYKLEIDELNKEDKRRRASGGNTQVHYSSFLI